jgi:hypothetical protein
MTDVARFETVTDLDEDGDPARVAVTARLEAILADGRRVPALDVAPRAAGVHAVEDYGASEWEDIAACLAAHGATVPAVWELRALPHDVVVSDALRARLTPPA